jgi:hypothetical protein
MYEKQLKIAEMVSKIWTNAPKPFKDWFHLRINSEDVTIVSTHKERPMRGITIAKTKLQKYIDYLASAIDGDKIDWKSIEKAGFNNGKGFEKGEKNGCKEYPDQADIINKIRNGDKELLEKLKLSELHFIASEFVLFRNGQPKKERIDIVAHNGKETVFFEVKEPDGDLKKAMNQLGEYIKDHSISGRYGKIFNNLIDVYPKDIALTKSEIITGFAIKRSNNIWDVEKYE